MGSSGPKISSSMILSGPRNGVANGRVEITGRNVRLALDLSQRIVLDKINLHQELQPAIMQLA
jgi:hypothetical protein